MKAVLTYSHKDYNLAWYAAKVLLKQTKFPLDKLILYGSEESPQLPAELQNSGLGTLRSANDSKKYPLGPNAMFAGLMKYARDQQWEEPIFMFEADGFPTCENWYDRVMAAHANTRRLASGSFVDWVDPPHLNGNMVIDPLAIDINPSLARITYEAWDVFHAEFFAKYGAFNREILNPRRKTPYNHTGFWMKQKYGEHRPAWIHGCQNFQMWEKINNEGFDSFKDV